MAIVYLAVGCEGSLLLAYDMRVLGHRASNIEKGDGTDG